MNPFEGFEFDGIRSDELGLLVEHINKPVSPQISNSRQSVPGMYGDINLGNAYSNKVFNITATFSAFADDIAFNDLVHNLANFLIRDADNGGEYELIFGDEPDVTYFGSFTSISEATQLLPLTNDSKIELVFTCSDPKGYLPQQTVSFDDSPMTLTPEGTGEIYPVYTIVPKKDVSEVAVVYDTSDEFIDVGEFNEEENLVDTNPVLVSDPCDTLASWNTITTPPFGMSTDIDGKMSSSTDSISVAYDENTDLYQYGTAKNHKAWFGPMVMHEKLSNPVNNFTLMFRLHHVRNYTRGQSKAEVYMVDEDGKRVGRIFLSDGAQGAAGVMGLYLGDESNETKVFYGHFGKTKNGTNTPTQITIQDKTTHKVKTGKGKSSKTKTEVKYVKKTENLTNYHNSNYFNNSFVQFTIQKYGTDCWVTAQECDIKTGKLKKTKIISNKKVKVKRDFSLSTIAFYGSRHHTYEDNIDDKTGKPEKTYNYGFNSITHYKVNLLNSGKPVPENNEIIAHAGDMIILDSESKHATLVTDGGNSSLDDKLGISTFPPITGGQGVTIGVSPDISDADIKMDYRPTYK